MLPLPEVPVMRDHRGDEQRCSAVVPARCLANRPNGHSGAGGASSVDAGRALCLAGAAVNSGASGGGRRSEGESFTEPGRGRGGGRGGPADMPPTAANSASRRGTHGAEQGRPLVCEPRLGPRPASDLPRVRVSTSDARKHSRTACALPGLGARRPHGAPTGRSVSTAPEPGPPRRGGRGRNHQQTPDVGSAASRRAGTRPAHGSGRPGPVLGVASAEPISRSGRFFTEFLPLAPCTVIRWRRSNPRAGASHSLPANPSLEKREIRERHFS